MKQLVPHQAEARKFSYDAKIRFGTRGLEVVRSNTPGVSSAPRRVSIIVVYRKADGAGDYPNATDGQWHYDERRWRSKAQRHRRCNEPELTLAPQSGNAPDPRLAEFVRLLARHAARRWYEQTNKEHGSKRS